MSRWARMSDERVRTGPPSAGNPAARRIHGVLLAGLTAWVAVTALTTPPRLLGDAPEYLLMAESLARHGDPGLRDSDIEAVAAEFARHGVEFPPGGEITGYYAARNGQRYSYHFWAYPLTVLPFRFVVDAVGGDPLLAPQFANALLMMAPLLAIFLWAPLDDTQRLALNGLLFLSPACWFILWPHPEIFSLCLATLSLLAGLRDRNRLAVLLASLAALQNPQLMLLAGFHWARGTLGLRVRRLGAGSVLARSRLRWRDAVTHGLPALAFLAHPAFYYVNFGTPSIVADEATSLVKVSPARALGLLFDLNVGLLPYVPVAVVAWLVVSAQELRRPRLRWQAGLFGVFVLMLLANTLQWNYNHGTSGPSRYVVWMLPMLFLPLVTRPMTRAWAAVLGFSVAVQLAVVVSRGGLIPRYDYLEHSAVARWVLNHLPALYDPDYEVFIKRTLHFEGPGTRGPYVYRNEAGECRKVLAKRRHRPEVAAQCGGVPPAQEAFFAAFDEANADHWTYVEY